MNTIIMKTTLMLLTILSSLNLYAERVKGTIYYENDSLNVIFEIPLHIIYNKPDYRFLQYGVEYTDQEGTVRYIKPDAVKEIRFSYNNEQIRLISKFNTLEVGHTAISVKTKIFLKLEVDGKLQLYSFCDKLEYKNPGTTFPDGAKTGSTVSSSSVERYVLQKENGELKRVRELHLKNDIIRSFEDCPDLLYKINHEKISKDDLISMVKYYNKNCISSAGLPIE